MKSFLLVDDNKCILEMYKLQIENNYTASVDCAYNGKEALEKTDVFFYDVILSDIEMPIMSGIEFYKLLKEKQPGMAGKVAFISGSTVGLNAEFLKEERLSYLTKPFKQQDFLNLINSVLRSQDKISSSSKRYNSRRVVNNVFIAEPLIKAEVPIQITGLTENISEGGICISYEGKEINPKTNVIITTEALGIYRKEAEVVWSASNNQIFKAGLKWLS